MSYEIRDNRKDRLTPSERRALVYEKEPVYHIAELWEKYPDGGYPGWYCLVKEKHALYGWNEQAGDWTELGQGMIAGKHDKRTGMLLRFLACGSYTEKDGILPGEVVIVPMQAGDYYMGDSRYMRSRQHFRINENELGQVVVLSLDGEKWELLFLPIYDFIHAELLKYQHNRGVVLNNPNEVDFLPEAQEHDYVYYQDEADLRPFMWVYDGRRWQKTINEMPSAEVTGLSEYAKHGYKPGEQQKTLADVDRQLEGVTGNMDGGNASSRFGGCIWVNGGNATTEV